MTRMRREILRAIFGGALVALNSGKGEATLALPGSFDGLDAVDLPGWSAPSIQRTDGITALEIPGRTGGVLVTKEAVG